jgi:ribonucleoside-diphosphate reductase alpha chain
MNNIVHGITVDYSRDEMFSESGLSRLKEGYMHEGEKSPQERFAFVSKTFSSNPEHAQRLYDYASKMWLSYSTPILSYGKTLRSLPISCFASYLGDSMRSILDTSSETRMLAVVGGGVGLHVGLRPGDKKSSGIIPHLKTYDIDTLAFKQGTTRRGATAAYLNINHPEIIDFLEMRKLTGGDPNRKCLNLHHGINVSDDFMQRVEKLSLHGDTLTAEQKEVINKFPLINPNTKEVVEYVSVMELWERILTIRMETGEPYLWFIDTANKALPEFQKAKGLVNRGSNLCLTGDALVEIKESANSEAVSMRLDDFVLQHSMGRFTDVLVKSHDGESVVWSSISAAAQTGVQTELYEIETTTGKTIRCTADHKIFTTNRGYVRAKDLLETDTLLED